MFTHRFGIEVEFTGITRKKAAETAADYLHGKMGESHGYYGTIKVTVPDGRVWKFMSDSSITRQRRENGRIVPAEDNEYSVEMVSPVLTYREDIETVQSLARRLYKAGGFANRSCGIHIHLDGAEHTPRSIRNFVNLIASRNDLFYKALQIPPNRMKYCKKMDDFLVSRLNGVRPTSFARIERVWYEGYDGDRSYHYHDSRYHFLNLHSFFHGNHTVELRGFNGTLHAGKIRAYIVFALALDHQALTQKSASYRKVQAENEKFAMRTYLNRIGFVGEEFRSCRMHLYSHLDGDAAWRYAGGESIHSNIRRQGDDENGKDEEIEYITLP